MCGAPRETWTRFSAMERSEMRIDLNLKFFRGFKGRAAPFVIMESYRKPPISC